MIRMRRRCWKRHWRWPAHRVVVKRPRKAPCIDGPKPSHALDGKSSRYDIYPKKALKP
jgi:16S rRNA (guanine1516-N2)-methyltransferase